MANYDNVKLGLIDTIKVWNQRRQDEAVRRAYFAREGENPAPEDYAKADKLKEELLKRKQARKQERKNRKAFNRYKRENPNDEIGLSDFTEGFKDEHEKPLTSAEAFNNSLSPKNYPSYGENKSINKGRRPRARTPSPENQAIDPLSR